VEGPNTVSTTDAAAIAAGDVTITAANLIGGSGRFQQWLQFFGNGHVTGQQLTVKAGDPSDAGSSDAIAVYSVPPTTSAPTVRLRLTSGNASRKRRANYTFIPAVTRGCAAPATVQAARTKAATAGERASWSQATASVASGRSLTGR
jgi:hypothetical protein